ncbi:MAG: ABC transporter ATP-binding protein [Planctomycetes bacterium]|nr:ABC transporter ATP-binding protein [Planctomycetota bacterium]
MLARFEKRYPRGATITAELQIPAGFSVTTLFGPSGCGKTTVLRCLAGLERPEHGVISAYGSDWFDARRGINLSPQQRDIGFLFQDYALFPHLTVAENIRFGIRDHQRAAAFLNELLGLFELSGLEHRRPRQISGGQQQRVALARVLARRPKLLLLDEPLSALDATLREQMRSRLRRQLAQFQIPVVVVTHDRTEAIALSDRIVVMESGRIRQSGTVQQVVNRPDNLEVARIVGVETVATGEILGVDNGLATVHVGTTQLLAVAPEGTVRLVHVCIRGEDVALQKGSSGESSVRNHLPGTILSLVPEGPLVRVGLDCGFDLTALVTRPACEELHLQVGDRVTANLKAPAIHLMARE